MRKLYEWFTLERRQAIQVFLGGLAPFAIMFGFGNEGVWEQALIISGAIMQFISSALSLVNLRGVLEIWTILRGAIYTLGTVVSPALVLLGFYDDATNATILTGISLALGAISNLLAVFTAGYQDKQALEKKSNVLIDKAFREGLETGLAK
jgi:hypothetical protein